MGTLVIVVIATIISVPVGILAAMYIAEFGPETRLAGAVRFAAKVLTGLPSILAGVFAFAVVVAADRRFLGAGRRRRAVLADVADDPADAEEAIKRVPAKMREAAVGMGATPTQVVTKVVLPTAFPGILTGVMLAVARAAGETAPLLFTALFSELLDEPHAAIFSAQNHGRPDEAHRFFGGAHLQFLWLAFRQSDSDGVVGGAGPGRYRLVANLVGQTIARRSTLP